MDSYPQMRPSMHWYPRNPEAFPPQMGFDPTKFPTVQGPWSCPTHAYPMPCGNHMNFPGYYHNSPPPHPNFYHPQPSYYWGSYPGFFEPHPTCQGKAFPAPYMPDHPIFQGKNTGHLPHCCGCPNHVCNPKGGSSVKIEEHDPDLENPSDGSGSLIPLKFRNYPYPIAWIPPNFVKNEDQSPCKPSRKDLDSTYDEIKPAGMIFREKPKLSECFPLEMQKRHPFVAHHEVASDPSTQKEDQERTFQYPIIWIPSWEKPNEEGKERTDPLLSSSEVAPSLGATDSSKAKAAQSKSVLPKDGCDHLAEKFSPVNKDAGNAAERNRDKEVRKVDQSAGRKQSLSPTKSSKLPPVCLRVDPLPKKKNGNDVSRSINPKEEEKKGKFSTVNQIEADARNKVEHNTIARAMNERKDNKLHEKKVKVIEVKSGDSGETKDQEIFVTKKFHEEEKDKGTGEKTDGNDTKKELKINAAGDGNFRDSTGEKIAKRTFLDSEAATLIQAAYRGYEVRRWHMLQKLKQLTAVREGLIKIRGNVEELKSSNDGLCDTSKFERQKVVIGESIMSLLLKLDTIQGVHPSLRDERKSLARELVGLQEEIDSLICKPTSALKGDGEGREEISGSEANHVFAKDTAEVDGTLPSSIVEPPRSAQEEKREELNGLEQGQLENSKDNGCSDTSPDVEHLNSAETKTDASQNACLEALNGKVKEANDDINDQPVTDRVGESRKDPKEHSSESADYTQLSQRDQTGDVSADIPSHGEAAGPESAETVMPAEETNTSRSSEPPRGNHPDDSIFTGGNDMEKEEGDRAAEAVVEHDVEGGFCVQTTSSAHVEGDHMSSDAVQRDGTEELPEEACLKEEHSHPSEHTEADGDDLTDSALDSSVSVPSSAVPNDVVPEKQPHEESREVVPSSQEEEEEDGNNVHSLLVPGHNEPELEHSEMVASLLGGEVDDNNNMVDTAEVGKTDGEAKADVQHPGHQPDGEAKPELEENWMKTSATDGCQASVVGETEENVEMTSNDLEEEEMHKEEVLESPLTTGSEKENRETNADGAAPGDMSGRSVKAEEENEKLRLMMERLMEVGREQIDAIAKLSGRVKDLESKLAGSKKSRRGRRCPVRPPRNANARAGLIQGSG